MGDALETNLAAYHNHANIGREVSGSFTKVRTIADANLGKVFLCTWVREGKDDQMVAVKKMNRSEVHESEEWETNDRRAHEAGTPCKEDAMTEIGVNFFLAGLPDVPPSFPTMLACFEAGNHISLVMEYIAGDELFDWVAASETTEEISIRCFRQVLEAVTFLHHHRIGHRDISLENLLRTNAGDIKLIDFGAACQTHSEAGVLLRYFRGYGKAYYVAPEVVVPGPDAHFPEWPRVQVDVPADARRGDVVLCRVPRGCLCEVRLLEHAQPGQQCQAELWGYGVPSVDVFACGVVWFILNYRFPPWERVSDSDFASFERNGLPDLLTTWGHAHLSKASMRLLVAMTQFRPSARPTIDECKALLELASQELATGAA
mmetsp:Transcript_14887/g.32694  ORF Transcript_14887/g.32694 Transcript_14887/m.32694 type:complete len:374 (-) Transcript_14887:88-1209(-)